MKCQSFEFYRLDKSPDKIEAKFNQHLENVEFVTATVVESQSNNRLIVSLFTNEDQKEITRAKVFYFNSLELSDKTITDFLSNSKLVVRQILTSYSGNWITTIVFYE